MKVHRICWKSRYRTQSHPQFLWRMDCGVSFHPLPFQITTQAPGNKALGLRPETGGGAAVVCRGGMRSGPGRKRRALQAVQASGQDRATPRGGGGCRGARAARGQRGAHHRSWCSQGQRAWQKRERGGELTSARPFTADPGEDSAHVEAGRCCGLGNRNARAVSFQKTARHYSPLGGTALVRCFSLPDSNGVSSDIKSIMGE